MERAHRDTGEHPRPAATPDTEDTQDTDHRNPAHRQNHLPEGAEQ
ncbi:hypothetical protein [Streptomyces sp. NPDC002553]